MVGKVAVEVVDCEEERLALYAYVPQNIKIN